MEKQDRNNLEEILRFWYPLTLFHDPSDNLWKAYECFPDEVDTENLYILGKGESIFEALKDLYLQLGK